jgi:hypothetical protein
MGSAGSASGVATSVGAGGAASTSTAGGAGDGGASASSSSAAGCVPTGDEVCNGADDDCDGSVDELGATCSTGKLGVCAAGHLACVAGKAECVADTTGSDESCNGLDDDCNGEVDDMPHAVSDTDSESGLLVNSVSFNGKSFVTVKAGTTVDVAVSFEFVGGQPSSSCDFRILAGFHPGKPQYCPYEGASTCASMTAFANFPLVAPATPGAYALHFEKTGESCSHDSWQMSPPALAVGMVCVVP